MRLGSRGNIALLILIAQLTVFACVNLDRHHLQPPAHHPIRLGKEAVTANVHAVALVADSARYAAGLQAGLDHDRLDSRTPLEFDSGRQAGRARSDNDRRLFSQRISPLDKAIYREGRKLVTPRVILYQGSDYPAFPAFAWEGTHQTHSMAPISLETCLSNAEDSPC